MAAAAAHIPIASSGSFLITPNVGLMVWVLVIFGICWLVLRRFVFPPINQMLDNRAHSIANEIDSAEKLRTDAQQVLDQYRQRLAEARSQADEIVTRARQAGEAHQKEVVETARSERERLLAQTRHDVEVETRRAIDEIRREVADLTVLATEKVTRKTLTDADQRRLVEEALSDLDFSVLSGDSHAGGGA
ncbi:MAG: F0F1 ATP synthase subunit B [Acidobacteriota bacterium]|nr:F0F1 ATP synthase subunit B [Acidobacteriota bacterium]